MHAAHRTAAALLIAAAAAIAQNTAAPLDRVAFLLGDWLTHDDTELGHADAASSFTADLDRHIVVRRSTTKYTSGKNAGTKHSDLLIVYAEGTDSALRAIYFDGEGHVIHYRVTVPAANMAQFESDPAQPGPRYRLTHKVTGNRMETRFEMALPGQAEFKTYVSGVSTRQ